MEIYNRELEKIGISSLKNHKELSEKAKVILRMRQIGITLVQIRKFSKMTVAELKNAMYPLTK